MGAEVEPCYTCRRRRIQCDRSGNPCAKCTASGLECYKKRPFRFVRGVAIRGKMQGISFETSDCTGAQVGRSALEEFPVSIDKAGTPSMALTGASKPALNPSLILQDPSVSNLDAKARYYLDYYNERICKLFIVYDSEKNPFRTLIPLALTDETLFKAAAALAARHKVNTGRPFYEEGSIVDSRDGHDGHSHYDALLFKQQAIQRLARDLHGPCAKDTTMASIFLLIFLDLLESGRDRWNYHLEGLKRLLEINPLLSGSETSPAQDPGRTVLDIRAFITRQMYLIETLGATFVRPKLLSPFNAPEQSSLLQQTETVEQSFLGCPEYLLHTIQSLSTSRDAITMSTALPPDTITTHTHNIHQLLNHISNFDCTVWASTLSHPPTPQDTTNLPKLAYSYKLGAQIYGHRILDALTHTDTTQDILLQELLTVIARLKTDDALLKCILWPIFVAGLECRLPPQRAFLLGCLEQFWADTSCFNGINAARILQGYWRMEMGEGETEEGESFAARWIFTIGRLGEDWLLI